MESANGGLDAPVPSARWQEGEDSVRGLRRVIHNTGSLEDALVLNHFVI